ncbi:hypothetical protein OK414_11515 [Priestia sp. JV24]|uniref:hypothetical protein n=1 Tax=Priestia TaxID=2800373 RepID=UPI0021D65621|nr:MULTISPECIES: hypothetical protein [Priestia]MCU7710652.1 hypothetical protein [Priestia megaterium]MCW1045672.1 hypothetical protein [Priestia sp. JV24]
MIAKWDIAKRDSTTVRTIITVDTLVRKDVTSMTTTIMVTKNALVATMIHVMRKNIIVKTAVTMITALLFFNAKVKTPRLFS